MSGSSRRRALEIMGWAMAMPALSLPVRLAAAAKVQFPAGSFVLRRRLERGLGDGAAVVVTRDWECGFRPQGEGALIEARQIAVEVDAPPMLAALADVERRREVTGLFPMTLDGRGRIAGWSEGQAGLEAALQAAKSFMERHLPAPSDARDAKRYLAAMSQTAAAAVSQVPRDLFFPQTGERSAQRALELPGGGEGRYEVTIRASAREADGLLEMSERQIVTHLGDSQRASRERWSIS